VVSDDDRRSWGLSQRSHTPDAPPIWTPSSPQLPAPPTSERHVDIPVTLEREEATHSSRQDCMSSASGDNVSEPPSSQIVDLPLPVIPRITLPRFSLSHSGIHKMLECRLASSESGNDNGNTEFGSAAPDPLLDGLLSSAQNGEFHSIGNCCSMRTWNCLSLTIISYSLVIKKPHRCSAVLYRRHQRSAISLAEARMFFGQFLRIMNV
jgi:hypothetical protein